MAKISESVVAQLKKEAATNGEPSVTKETRTLVGIPSNKRLEFFQSYAPMISQLIPHRDDLNAARIVQLAVQLTDNPKIAECHPKSIIGSVMQSVILGFEPIPGLGLAAFIPYSKQLTFQIMYQGLIDLAYRTDMYDAIYAEVVRDGDDFHYSRGLKPDLYHEPKEYKGNITHVYAVAYVKGSSMPIFVVMTWEEVIEIRNRSSHGYMDKSSPWQTRPGEMGKKTALKQLMKILPKSVQIQKAVASDERTISVDDFNKGTKEVDYSKMAEDANFQDVPEEKEAEPEKSKPKQAQKQAKSEPGPPPTEQKDPEKGKDAPGPEKEAEKADSGPKVIDECPICGKSIMDFHQTEELDGFLVHFPCAEARRIERAQAELGKNEGDPEKDPDFEVEEAESEEKADVDPSALLKDAFEETEHKRMIKYLRERANDAREALAFYTDSKAPKGIHNLGELCAYFEINALTSHDVTVAQYEAIKEFITEVKKQHTDK
jgi:recombination protein RecT